MGTSLNDTPSANRLHIGVFGRTNSGKSSLINALTGQQASIVADVAGTTTDPVYKAMEIHPLGPCVIVDTAGFDDATELGKLRLEKTELAAQKTDIALLVIDAERLKAKKDDLSDVLSDELSFAKRFSGKRTPLLVVLNKIDVFEAQGEQAEMREKLETLMPQGAGLAIVLASAQTGAGMDEIKQALVRLLPEDYGAQSITGDLVSEGDFVLLVMPQDIQAPKGRLILPQVQTLRELLDKKCHALCVTTDQLEAALSTLGKAPKLIITDSQVFPFVYEKKPKESMLTSFSVLFAAHKGDIDAYMEGAKAIDALTEHSKVLIAECCTHAPLTEDIGRVKIPRLLRKRVGEGLQIDMVSGTDYPEDLSEYDLVIQCGACMFNRKYVLSRIGRAKEQCVPITNYGVAIAHMSGILERVVTP